MTKREAKAMELRDKYNSFEYILGGEAINRALDGIHPLDSLFLEMADWMAQECAEAARMDYDNGVLIIDREYILNAGKEEARHLNKHQKECGYESYLWLC